MYPLPYYFRLFDLVSVLCFVVENDGIRNWEETREREKMIGSIKRTKAKLQILQNRTQIHCGLA